MTKTKRPQLQVFNRQRKVRISLPRLRQRLDVALTVLTPAQRRKLPDTIEITLINLKTMIAVHRDFLGDPTPTDVITFQHGEILVCPEIAVRQGKNYDRSAQEETLLYGIHGLLHLCGYKDKTPRDFERMRREQERVLAGAVALHPAK